ncbi:MAG: zinc-dependent metalloprotease [Deltaproteobacteria bacterium]|nr:zinc-dependent metalloprotease [Deltaproteobacteria bacterium]
MRGRTQVATLGASAVVFLLSIGLASCERRPPINQVQENVLEKSVLEGEWYYLQTVIDAPYSVRWTFVGEQGNLQKIRWEIQEDYLIARRSYEFIDGSETDSISGPGAETGTAIAMYAIESHFDIRHDYNSVTGEETNVIVENDTDRRWYERRYMRVDWSKNLVTDADFLSWARIFDGVTSEPTAYHVEDPTDPNAPRFERNAAGQLNYMDIVNKMFLEPTSVYLEDWGEIPTCWLLDQAYLDCAPAEVTVRNSFLRVDESRDYQPLVYTGDRMDRFGYFVVERQGWDPRYGVVDSARFRFATRHNLWQQSHRTNADGSLVRCTTNADCDDGRGSVCDFDWGRAHRQAEAACTLAYRDRQVRPIAYYLSGNLPEDLEPDARHLAEGWNGAFVETIGSLRENECLSLGGDAGECAAERERPDAQQVYVLCHSPVREEDPAACGDRGIVANIGDIRYSLIGWVSDPGEGNPLGYGPSQADPETGELIQGNAFVYGSDVEVLSAWARDLVGLLNGDITPGELTSGANVRGWVDAFQERAVERAPARSAHEHVVPLDGEDAERLSAAMDFSWVHGDSPEADRAPARPGNLRELVQSRRDSLTRMTRRGVLGTGDERGYARLERLRDTEIEAGLITPEIRLAAGLDPRLGADPRSLEASSPLRGRSLRRLRALDRARRLVARDGCRLGAEFADEGLMGLAREIARAAQGDGTLEWFGETYSVLGDDGQLDQEAVRDMLRHPIFEAVTAHEVGHTLGLRHNFAASGDSLNYHPEYWRLRDDGNMQPRAWDPITDAEIDGRQREYQYSSVMDYGNNFVVTDAAGIGHYDRAAIKMGYGDLVEVFTNAADPHAMAWSHVIQRFGWSVVLREETFEGGELSAHPYTEIPQLLGGIDRIEQRADVPYTSLVPEEALLRDGVDEPVVDAQGRPAVYYRFCSDEVSDLGPDCLLYDAGADPYEALQSVIDTYWNYYLLNNYRRERLGFEVEPYFDRIYWRYLVKLQYANQIYALDRAYFEDSWGGDPSLESFFSRPDGYGSWTLGVAAGYQLLTRIVTTPEPGGYSLQTRPDEFEAFLPDYSGAPEISIDDFQGRYLDTTWDFDQGYFWFDQLERVGYFYDKTLALQVLVDPETSFVGTDTASDVRTYALSFHNTFGPSMSNFFRSLMGNDWRVVAPHVNEQGDLQFPDAADHANRVLVENPIDPSAGFTVQLYAAAFSMGLTPMTYDQTYIDRCRIFVRGGAEAVELDPMAPTVEFTDPRTGLTFVAPSYPDARGRETGVGAQMIRHANALRLAGSERELARFVDNLNSVRALTWYLGFGG